MDNVIEQLQARGFIEAMTSDDLAEVCRKPLTLYCGFDPTADSLHLGNMVGLMGLAWFQRYGHRPIGLVGGATGLIGDPSGKSQERPLIDEHTLQKNVEGIRRNMEVFLDFNDASAPAKILNNYDWFAEFGFIQFLRDVGRHCRMGQMLAKESVKTRLASEEGLSFTEFSYQVLQGYDFLHLYRNEGVTLEIGGSDQWGNITAGTELIRKLEGGQAYGVTFPLLIRSDGKKFGKSENGAIWLAPDRLSPYEFYQHLVRVPDADVGKLLRMLTFMDLGAIRDIEVQMSEPGYQPNTAQKILAAAVTEIVHGEQGLQTALKVTKGAAPGSDSELDVDTLHAISKDMPMVELPSQVLVGMNIVDLLVESGLQKSKGQARRLLENGGVYLNNHRVEDTAMILGAQHLIGGAMLLLAAGKKNKLLVKAV